MNFNPLAYYYDLRVELINATCNVYNYIFQGDVELIEIFMVRVAFSFKSESFCGIKLFSFYYIQNVIKRKEK